MKSKSWELLLAVVACLVYRTTSHVALTFPPARTYDLDFLDTSRTPGPCGMPKGEFLNSYNYVDDYNKLLIYWPVNLYILTVIHTCCCQCFFSNFFTFIVHLIVSNRYHQLPVLCIYVLV